jgi:hypothetical protein
MDDKERAWAAKLTHGTVENCHFCQLPDTDFSISIVDMRFPVSTNSKNSKFGGKIEAPRQALGSTPSNSSLRFLFGRSHIKRRTGDPIIVECSGFLSNSRCTRVVVVLNKLVSCVFWQSMGTEQNATFS